MFEFLFKYPVAVFSRGELVLLSGWPIWVLVLILSTAAGALAWQIAKRRPAVLGLTGPKSAAIWALQICIVAVILLLIWHPALSVAMLKPQQNIVAVLVDGSRSMGIQEGSETRLQQAFRTLNNGLLQDLEKNFQIRLYQFGDNPNRVEDFEKIEAASLSSRIGESLKQIAADATSLPIGAIVLLSDGADTTGGIGIETISEIRRHRIPVHTIGFGREAFERDIEIADAMTPARVLPGSQIGANVRIRQSGYTRQKGRLIVRDSGKVVTTQEIVFSEPEQTESVVFSAGAAGSRVLEFTVESMANEENLKNNAVTRLVHVQQIKPRLLYLEGEPRWEFKFIRRAIEEDASLELATILRTTQNKIYRQGIHNPGELAEGFPAEAEELFAFKGIILGSVESGYFTSAQQELIREFADRRGGGILFLGGRAALAEGGYGKAPFGDVLPVILPAAANTFQRERVQAELTVAGRESSILRLEQSAPLNAERWKKMPALADFQRVGDPKPGALVLAELREANGRTSPLLITQQYGRGRTAVFATGGSWRWQMSQELSDQSHELFWQQMLRWLVADAPGQVAATTPKPVLSDESRVPLRAEVRDKAFRPILDGHVEAKIIGPSGLSETVQFEPHPQEQGIYTAQWTAQTPGSFLAEIVARQGGGEVGRDVVMFRREDGVAENFRVEQNRELLQKLSVQTGGQYYRPDEAARLASDISYSEAGITIRETRDLWDMPFVFLMLLGLRSAEWLLRRKWGFL